MGKKPQLVWNRLNIRHIKKHHLTQVEVEEAYLQSKRRKVKDKHRYLVYGLTKNGRPITIILSTEKQANPYVVTARNMNNQERKAYYDQT